MQTQQELEATKQNTLAEQQRLEEVHQKDVDARARKADHLRFFHDHLHSRLRKHLNKEKLESEQALAKIQDDSHTERERINNEFFARERDLIQAHAKRASHQRFFHDKIIQKLHLKSSDFSQQLTRQQELLELQNQQSL